MLVTIIFFFAGLALLLIGANALVSGASKLSLSFGVSPLVIGLTVVAFGTSAPEMAVTVGAVLDGTGDVALGNIVGSNIFNILVVLGLSAIVIPLSVHTQVIRQEMPIMLGAGVLLLAMSLNGVISPFEGLALLALLILYTVFLIVQAKRAPVTELPDFLVDVEPAKPGAFLSRWYVQVLLVTTGLIMLVLGSQWLVESAVVFARYFGLSELVIGLTIVAAGTSLPEVATSVAAALKGERDMAVGNVVGSCIFNTFGGIGLASVVAGLPGLAVAPSALNFDLWVMLAAFLACLPVFVSGREISRWEGGLFFAYYVAYLVYLIMQARQYEALPLFSSAMLSIVIPVTVVTLVVTLLRHKSDISKGG